MGEGKITPLTTPTPLNLQSRNIAHVITSTISPHATFGQDRLGQDRPRGYFSPYSQTCHFFYRASAYTDARY